MAQERYLLAERDTEALLSGVEQATVAAFKDPSVLPVYPTLVASYTGGHDLAIRSWPVAGF